MADTDSLRQAISDAVVEVADAALDQCLADTLAAAPEKTGALKALTDRTPVSLAGDFVASGSVFCDAKYAEWTDAGSEPHLIEGNPLLHFYWDRIGKEVWFHFVNHPGSPGTQWFNGGVDGGEPMLSRWTDACEAANASVSVS